VPKHIVKCYYCKKEFDADAEPYVKVSNGRRYAHKACHDNNVIHGQENRLTGGEKRLEAAKATNSQEEVKRADDINRQILFDYIRDTIGKYFDLNWALITRQINSYIKDRKWSYSGIYRTMIYYLEVKHQDVFMTHGNLSFVVSWYPRAFEYYYAVFQKQQENLAEVRECETKYIKISTPQVRRKLRLFDMGEE
jgi:hypothetical protein